MFGIVRFTVSGIGRALQIVVGVLLVMIGFFAIAGIPGALIAIAGLPLVLEGLYDFCFFAPLFGYPLSGPAIRRMV